MLRRVRARDVVGDDAFAFLWWQVASKGGVGLDFDDVLYLQLLLQHFDATRDIAFVGGIDLAHSRRDDRDHGGDPQALDVMPDEYGDTPPWHDLQAALTGPVVHDVETVFRERWEDPTTMRRSLQRSRPGGRPASSGCSTPTFAHPSCGRASSTVTAPASPR